jgi:hypothetical protein
MKKAAGASLDPWLRWEELERASAGHNVTFVPDGVIGKTL